MRHTISAGSHRQELCPFLKIKQPEQQEPKPSGSFSVNSEVKQHRALQSTQIMTAGKKMFCTCLSSVDVESFSSKLCFHQGNCFCMLTFDSFFFKDTNIFFLTTGTGQLQVWADWGLRGEEMKAIQAESYLYLRQINSWLSPSLCIRERKKFHNLRMFHPLPRQRQMDLDFTGFQSTVACPSLSHPTHCLCHTQLSAWRKMCPSEPAKLQQLQSPPRHGAQRKLDGNPW